MTQSPTCLPPTHQRWKLTIEYDGKDFAGWQRQASLISGQEAIETAIYKFSGEEVRLHVAGRTDAGVHAIGQVAHADLHKRFNAKTVETAINAYLRDYKIAVVKAEAVSDDFHARFKATKRSYCYKILMNRRAPTPLENNYVWRITHELNIEAMQEAANHLIGTHDFTSFRAADCQANSPIRTMNRLEIIETTNSLIAGRHIEIWAEAKSFLHHQIRNIAGSLKCVGEGKWTPDDIKQILKAKDRQKAGIKAPACGLYFVKVEYD